MKTEDEGALRACPSETAAAARQHRAFHASTLPPSHEEWAFQQLPFVRHDAKTGQTTNAWAPCEIPEDDASHGYSERCAIGTFYAMELIGHARQSKDGDWVKDVCEEIVQRGKWTGIEIGFFSALGDFVATGTIKCISSYFDAKPIGGAS